MHRHRHRTTSRRAAAGVLALAGLLLPALSPAQLPVPELSHGLTRLATPAPAPDFRLKDMDGEEHALSDYRGKVVMLNFWATWCPPCRREMPSMEAVYQSFREQDFIVLAINEWETEDHVFAFMGQLPVDPGFPILFDSESQVAPLFGVKGLPTTVLIDRQGRIVYRAVGGRDFDHPEVRKIIRTLLAEEPVTATP